MAETDQDNHKPTMVKYCGGCGQQKLRLVYTKLVPAKFTSSEVTRTDPCLYTYQEAVRCRGCHFWTYTEGFKSTDDPAKPPTIPTPEPW